MEKSVKIRNLFDPETGSCFACDPKQSSGPGLTFEGSEIHIYIVREQVRRNYHSVLHGGINTVLKDETGERHICGRTAISDKISILTVKN